MMTDNASTKILDDLTERLVQDNPLRLASEKFVDEVKDKVSVRLGEAPYTKGLDILLDRMHEVVDRTKHKTYVRSIGTVQHIGNGVATLSGLPAVHLEEVVTFPNGVQGMVLNLDIRHSDVILLGHDTGIQGGDIARGTGNRLSVPVGMGFLGRMVDPLGQPLDEGLPVVPSEFRYVERIAPGVIDRAPVDTPLYTGTKIIDALIPLGRGQRELIIGDRQTGKTTIAVDAILSQAGQDVICVYVAIGQKKTSVLDVVERLKAGGVYDQTIVVVSSPDDPPALRYLAPYSGVTMAEFFLDEGRDVLIIYDDLSKHADTYRELSLLLRRPPGREAYPGDIFYLHSRLLERACRLRPEKGGGSITALPIVVTQRGNISSYIVTNLISITDGQIMLDADMFNKGDKPAIDVGMSVSRVGSAAQTKAMKSVVKALKLELSQYEEVARFARFGTEVNESTQRQIDRGQRLQKLLNQPPNQPMRATDQVLVFYAITHGFMDDIPLDEIEHFAHELVTYLKNHAAQAVDHIHYQDEIDEASEDQILQVLNAFVEYWHRKRRNA